MPLSAVKSEPMIIGESEHDAALRKLMTDNGYEVGTVIPGTSDYAVTNRFMFTGGILRGTLEDVSQCYEQRWCYADHGAAVVALAQWRGKDCVDEPVGWHRHVPSGRRRKHGDPATEEICH